MTIVKTILKWFLGVLLLLFSIGGLFQEPFMAIVPLVLGLFIMPVTYDLFTKKTKLNFSSGTKWLISIIGIILIGYTASISETSKQTGYDSIVTKASGKIDEGRMDEALKLIEDAKSKYKNKKNKATDLEDEIEKSKDLNFVKEILAEMTDEEFVLLEKGSLSKPYLTQKTLNKKVIDLVKTHSPERAIIIKEIEEKREMEQAIAEAERKEKAEAEFNKNRRENIEKLFSAYDGSHRGLEKFIKDNMNDPDSYDHIETRYLDKGDHILVITKFRGANAFGGKVINSISANVDLEGNVIEILSQD